MEFLFSSVFHQYTLYSATPFVIPFVLKALQSRALSQRDSGFNKSMGFYLIQFLHSCTKCCRGGVHGAPHPNAPSVEQAIAAGKPVYESCLNDPDPSIRADAESLLRYACEQSAA